MVWKSPVIPWDLCSAERRDVLRACWERGELSYKLSPAQMEVYRDIRESLARFDSSASRWYAADISRQFGKDYTYGLIALETLMRARARGVRGSFAYGAPTRDAVKELLVPTLEELCCDCPPDMLPNEMREGTFRKSANRLTWDTGHQLVLVGLDINPDRMRGPKRLGCAISEAGFVDDLDYVIEEVVLAMFIRVPDAFLLLNSTPPKTALHTWSTKWIPAAKARGTYAHRTIDDNDMIDDVQRDRFVEALGGRTAEKARRELFAEHIPDETLVVVPEWAHVRGVDDGHGSYTGGCVRESKPPKYRDCYVAMDPGWNDLCAVLFAYWDFERALLVIEDDFAVAQANSAQVAELIREKERALWGSVESWAGGRMKEAPYKRVSDTDLRMIGDMTTIHSLPFVPTRKDDREAAINAMRVRVQTGKIEVHPRARNAIAHLDHAIWNKARTQFERSGKHGHFDAVAALVYLDRNVDRNRNPNPPALYGVDTSNMLVLPHQRAQHTDPLAAMFPKVAAKHEARRRQQVRRI